MNRQKSRRRLAEALHAAAAEFQAATVIPHCVECSRPCCRLDPLVLELEWTQLKALWKIEDSRAAFDRRLSSGKGPVEIRAMDGLYFVHGKVCPAYDEARGSCGVYGQPLKPVGCTDFPVYSDHGSIIADLRCEAVDLDALTRWIARAVGPEFRLVQSPDEAFPFLVTLSVQKIPDATAVPTRSARPRSSS